MSKKKKGLTGNKGIPTEQIIESEVAPIEPKVDAKDCTSDEMPSHESSPLHEVAEELIERIEAQVDKEQVELIKENTEKDIDDNESNRELEEVIVAPVPVVAEKSKKKKATEQKIKLADTSYHYFRNFVKGLLKSNGVESARFVKNDSGWNGHIAVNTEQKAMAKEVLAKYKIDNPDVKDLWW